MADTLFDPNNPSGPITVGKLKMYVDRDLCIGAATCVAVAPKTYILDSEAKAVYLESARTDVPETLIEAAKACPVAAIIITDETGKKIFPE